jgi:hypothetical protein
MKLALPPTREQLDEFITIDRDQEVVRSSVGWLVKLFERWA